MEDAQIYSNAAWDHAATQMNNPLMQSSSVFQDSSSAIPSAPATAFRKPSYVSNSPHQIDALAIVPDDVLKIIVTDPQKHGDGNNAFVTYLVTTKTVLDIFRVPEMSLRRRFQDFDWLHKSLADELPACILPPIPDKHRIDYITGDRFSVEFIEKRRLSLELYLNRLARHPTIQKSQALKKFLEVSDLRFDREEKKRENHVFENLSDTLMNAFAKIREPDQRFIDAKTVADKFEEDLSVVEKLQSRLLKQQSELEKEFLELSDNINALGQMETQITVPLKEFSVTIQTMCTNLKEMKSKEDATFFSSIREYITYCQNLKEVLRTRDQKQLDFEELSSLLESTTLEREKTLNPARYNRGIASFFKDKVQEIQGIDSEVARKIRLNKLEAKVAELQEAVNSSREIAELFSNEVQRELDFFQQLKMRDFKEILSNLADTELDYHRKGIAVWDELIPILEGMHSE